MRSNRRRALQWVLALAILPGCDDHEHGHDEHGHDEHGHDEHDEHGHDEHDEHGHAGDDQSGADEHSHHDDEHGQADEHGETAYGHDDHGHGHEGATEVITLWGESTQLFVEFPALVVGEESPFAAHLTRLQDHFDIDHGSVVVELWGGEHPLERFVVERPVGPGVFQPTVVPLYPGVRQVSLLLESPAASEVHDLGELTVFETRAEADAAAHEEEPVADEISYLLEQQWRVPFHIERVDARPMRPNIPAFARLTLPNNAETLIMAPHEGRLVNAGGRFPLVGEEVGDGEVLFGLSTAPQEVADPATLDLAVDHAAIRVEAAQREVDRLAPLVEQGVVAQRRLDVASSALSEAQAELRSARRRRSSLGDSQRVNGGGDNLDVPSPIGGTLAEIFVAPNAWVNEGQRLARVVDRDRLWLDVGVPEAYLGRLASVSGAWFRLDNVRGVIDVPATALASIGTEVDPATRTLPVRFHIDNVRRELFAGMTTQAHLIVDAPQLTAAVLIDAVVDDAGTDVVFVQTGGESFVRRPVTLGIRDGAYVEVVDGVALGEWVVTEGAYSVKLASTATESLGHGHAH